MFRCTRGKPALHLLALLLAFCLTGCSFGINVDTMLTPPKLSAQQEQIYQALKDAVRSEIRLKYPRRGSYLSAFILADIDGDAAEEAIVFYEKNSISAPDTSRSATGVPMVPRWKRSSSRRSVPMTG